MQGAALVLFVVLNWPLIHRVWRHRGKAQLASDGSGFRGNLRRWQVSTITGTVAAVHNETHTWGGGHIQAGYGAQGYAMPGGLLRIYTDHYETIRIQQKDGSQEDVRLLNFQASPTVGDTVSICIGRKRRRTVAFAVLNHTTRTQTLNLQNLLSLREGGTARQTIFLLTLIFGSLISFATSIFLGAGYLILFWFILLAVFIFQARRGRVRQVDLTPLWNSTSPEAQTATA